MGFNAINSCTKSSSNAGRTSPSISGTKIIFVCLFSVWDACSESLITFDQDNPSNDNSLAYIVENDVIQSCLLERLKQSHVEIRLNSKVKQFEYSENTIRIALDNEKIDLRTGLLVRSIHCRIIQREDFSIDCSRWISIEYSRNGWNIEYSMEL